MTTGLGEVLLLSLKEHDAPQTEDKTLFKRYNGDVTTRT